MPEALEKIQAVFKESKTFALLSKKASEDFRLLAKEALKHVLLEKKLDVISLPEHQDFQKKWKILIPEKKSSPVLRQTSIRIPKAQCKIKELNYENNDDFLSLILTSENGEITKDALIFEPVRPRPDAVFCFFDPHETETFQGIEDKITLPSKEKIIFLTSNGTTFSEKIAQIVKTVAADALSLRQISTLLFASLITETNNFIRPVSQEVLRFGSELLSLGADKELVKTVLNEEKTISSARLFGRALARTHIDETSNASWTFLSQKDIEKTGNLNSAPSFFYNILKNLRENIPYRPLSLLFWQAGQNVLAMATADEEKELVPLACALGVKLQSKYFTTGPFANFSEAEIRFRNALREMTSLKI